VKIKRNKRKWLAAYRQWREEKWRASAASIWRLQKAAESSALWQLKACSENIVSAGWRNGGVAWHHLAKCANWPSSGWQRNHLYLALIWPICRINVNTESYLSIIMKKSKMACRNGQ